MAFGIDARGVLVTVVISIVLFYVYQYRKENSRLREVRRGLLAAEKNANVSSKLKVLVGFGSCLDLYTEAIPLLTEAHITPPEVPKHHDVVRSKKDLGELFAYFMKEGAAAERYVEPNIFKEIIDVAKSLPDRRWAAGGNAPVLANRLAMEGCKNTLVVSKAGEQFRKMLHHDLEYLGSTSHDDDIHLLMEYKVGERFGDIVAPRANRLIIHSDQNNPKLSSLEDFGKRIETYNPNLIVVSALQMLDNYPFKENERESRMALLGDILSNLPPNVHSHFEMASFSEKAMMQALLDYVIPYSDSLGMNEQELPNLVSMMKDGTITTVSESRPRTAVILEQMRELYANLKQRNVRPVTRIHVHTLAFQAILTVNGSDWQYSKESAAKAALVGFRHICRLDEVDVTKARLIMDDSFAVSTKEGSSRVYFNASEPVSCWEEHDYEICLAPVLVCTEVMQTTGGGDNISGAGLVLQLR